MLRLFTAPSLLPFIAMNAQQADTNHEIFGLISQTFREGATSKVSQASLLVYSMGTFQLDVHLTRPEALDA
jgi:hypothetical protein